MTIEAALIYTFLGKRFSGRFTRFAWWQTTPLSWVFGDMGFTTAVQLCIPQFLSIAVWQCLSNSNILSNNPLEGVQVRCSKVSCIMMDNILSVSQWQDGPLVRSFRKPHNAPGSGPGLTEIEDTLRDQAFQRNTEKWNIDRQLSTQTDVSRYSQEIPTSHSLFLRVVVLPFPRSFYRQQ